MDLLFHEMVIIDEPFRRGRYWATVIDRLYGGTIGAKQNGSIIGETLRQKSPLTRSRRHDLRDRKTAGMVLEALNAGHIGLSPLAHQRQGARDSPYP